MTGLFSLTTRKPLAVLLSVLFFAGVGSTASAIALAAAAQAQQDLRSPDARDAATIGGARVPGASQDLRSPDARDAATIGGARVPAASQDLRSPDARDAATNPQSTTVRAEPPTRIVKITPDHFEWGDAAIGAAGMLALLLVLAGSTMAWTRHRHTAAGHLTAAS
jgi:uncharacterized iron-regulated membrane protein